MSIFDYKNNELASAQAQEIASLYGIAAYIVKSELNYDDVLLTFSKIERTGREKYLIKVIPEDFDSFSKLSFLFSTMSGSSAMFGNQHVKVRCAFADIEKLDFIDNPLDILHKVIIFENHKAYEITNIDMSNHFVDRNVAITLYLSELPDNNKSTQNFINRNDVQKFSESNHAKISNEHYFNVKYDESGVQKLDIQKINNIFNND